MRDIAHSMAKFMVASPRETAPIMTFTQFLEGCIGSNRLGNPLNRQWQAVIQEYVRRISRLNEQGFQKEEWSQLGAVLHALDQAKYQGTLECAGTCSYRARDYSRAVDCWERCNATQRREYYLAKAEVLGMPAGLEWLDRADDHDRILAEWEKEGGLDKASGAEWLQFIGPVLEKKKRYSEAFKVYRQLGNTAKVRECFTKVKDIASQQQLSETFDSLVDYLVQRHLCNDVLNVVEQEQSSIVRSDEEKAQLHGSVVRKFAYSDLTPDAVASRDFQRLNEFLNRVLSAPDWRNYLSMKETGAALERIEGRINTLRFYEGFVEAPDAEVKQHARARWMVTKRKQVEHFKSQGPRGVEGLERSQRELANRAHDWGIRMDAVLPPFPELLPEYQQAVKIEGLPPGTRVEPLSTGIERFQIGLLEVKINNSAKLVLVTNMQSFETLRIDLAHPDEVIAQAGVQKKGHGEDWLEFDVPLNGYSGRISWGGGECRLQLKIRDKTVDITF